MIQPGDRIPEYLGVDQDGKEYTRESLSGKKVILYFYPKDLTKGCTAEACSLRDGWSELKPKGWTIIGVSKDSAKSHKKFRETHDLPFPLITDEEKTLQETFGVRVEKSMYGRKYMGTLRSTFLIDEEGIVRFVMSGKEIKTGTHADQLLKVIETL